MMSAFIRWDDFFELSSLNEQLTGMSVVILFEIFYNCLIFYCAYLLLSSFT